MSSRKIKPSWVLPGAFCPFFAGEASDNFRSIYKVGSTPLYARLAHVFPLCWMLVHVFWSLTDLGVP